MHLKPLGEIVKLERAFLDRLSLEIEAIQFVSSTTRSAYTLLEPAPANTRNGRNDLLALLNFARRNIVTKTAFAFVQSQATPHGVDGSMA